MKIKFEILVFFQKKLFFLDMAYLKDLIIYCKNVLSYYP